MLEIVISYRDIDAHRSKNVVRSFLELFLNMAFTRQSKEYGRSLDFLDPHIEHYSALLNEAEGRIQHVRTKNARCGNGTGQKYLSECEEVFATPEIEDELRRLFRERQVHLQRRKGFLKRREGVQAEIDAFKSHPSFRVATPPRTLPDPVGPNRPLLFVLVFIGACALGVAASIFLNLMARSDS